MDSKKYDRHPFDGDGMVCSFAFRDGKVFFRNKFVRTKGFLDEQVGMLLQGMKPSYHVTRGLMCFCRIPHSYVSLNPGF